MSSFTINIPASLRMTTFEVSMLLATRLYEDGRLSAGQAAEMVGLSKRTFIEMLGKYGVSVFGYGMEDIENDLKNV
jgi:predicted HTH domain antitoxin